ncbi:calpain-13-like [Lacerta agilis]|uniref:calpain-13-like n=1 Tax=Lacerta agilis TaxID=80427 RepID=UPI00141912CC|nr:calpain-13-like [Lacerta agilis]
MGLVCCKEPSHVMERNRNPIPEMYPRKPEPGVPKPERAGNVDSPVKFKNQDFAQLRYQCLNHGVLFQDETFPANLSSIGPLPFLENPYIIEWRRPTEILSYQSPLLIVDSVSRFDILQGPIGDCWVLAALGSLTLQPRFLENVIPRDQGFRHDYAGIFHFRFWYLGDWLDVVIDDRLPFINGEYLSVHPRSRNEFWPPLLEKAYAKLHGSYRKLHMGYISEALVDFTGGVQISLDLARPSSYLYEVVKAAAKSGCLMGCVTPPVRGYSYTFSIQKNDVNEKNGIVQGHAYTVVETAEVPYMGMTERLIRLWNPYGHKEWIGAWSDRSMEWDRVPKQYKKYLYEDKDNGEFWMSYEDFQEHFLLLHVCNNVPTFLDFGAQRSNMWSVQTHVDRWVQGLSPEGAFSRNPRYLIQVQEPDMKNSNVVVSLTQKLVNDTRSPQPPGIRFVILKPLAVADKVLPKCERTLEVSSAIRRGAWTRKVEESLQHTEMSSRTQEDRTTIYDKGFIKQRDVTKIFQLSPGNYIIIPEISQGGQESEFILRIFLKNQNNYRAPNTELSPVVTEGEFALEVEQDSSKEQNVVKDKDMMAVFGQSYLGLENWGISEAKETTVVPKWNQDNSYENIFLRYANQASYLDASQLQGILNEIVQKDLMASRGSGDGFSFDSCRSLLALMDANGNGRLTLQEFEKLRRNLYKYKDIFEREDENNSGFLYISNLRKVIEQEGLFTDDTSLQLMTVRYGDSLMRINFPDFVCCMVRLETMAKAFRNLSADGRGIYFTEDQASGA